MARLGLYIKKNSYNIPYARDTETTEEKKNPREGDFPVDASSQTPVFFFLEGHRFAAAIGM